MAVYRRCTKCSTNLPQGTRTCSVHGKGGIVWGGVVDIGTRKKRRRKSIGYHQTKSEAVAAEQEFTTAWATGLAIEDHDLTVSSWLDQWLEGPASLKIRPTTLKSYRYTVRVIGEHIGDVRLQDLSLGRWQAFLAHLVKDTDHHRLAPSTARRFHAVMRRAMTVATSRGLVVRNVLSDPEAFTMRVPQTSVDVWSTNQLSLYLDTAMKHRLGLALWMATMTGARRSEIVGMQWRDIDLEAGEWHVRRAMLITREGTPKSAAGNRIVGLGDATIERLTKWHREQRRGLLSAGINPMQSYDLPVFNRPGEAVPVHPDTITKLHYKVVKGSGLPAMKMHGLRHCHATHLLAAGVSIKAVSDRLGHSTAAFTLTQYAQSLPSERRTTAEKYASILGAQAG